MTPEEIKIQINNILKAVNENPAAFGHGNRLNDLREYLNGRLKLQKIRKLFKISDLPDTEFAYGHLKIDDHRRISYCKDKWQQFISRSDDDRQPENEYLYIISFPTGAYIFGDSYRGKTFGEFLGELKTFGPKYSDTPNHTLYFSPDNAAAIHKAFPGILKKYMDKVAEEDRYSKIQKLKEQLKKLESEGE